MTTSLCPDFGRSFAGGLAGWLAIYVRVCVREHLLICTRACICVRAFV